MTAARSPPDPRLTAVLRQLVTATLDDVRAGFVPADVLRDPAGYTDIAALISEQRAAGRLAPHVAAGLLDGLERARRLGETGSESRAAGDLEQFVKRVQNQVKGRRRRRRRPRRWCARAVP